MIFSFRRVIEENQMKRINPVLVATLLVFIQLASGCGKTTLLTKTETLTMPAQNITQTTSITGPVTTTTQTTTVPGPTTTTIQTIISTTTITTPGPTTTVILTKNAFPAQGMVYVSSLNPAPPAVMHFSDKVTISFEYVITDPLGALMWVLPYTKGQLTPNGTYQGSFITPAGRSNTSRFFSVTSGAAAIDQLYFKMSDSTNKVVFFEAFLPVDYTFGP